jgi:tRNA threonylcarbamoyladenosine biosynthesis protein TsaB
MPEPQLPPKSLTVLGLDTSTERLAVALSTSGQPFHANAEGGARASGTLLPQVAQLLAQAGVVYADLDLIAFGRGPGAFTGLRTACAVAQGLGLGLGRPVLAVDSLLIVAEDARVQAGAETGPFTVAVAMDARMDEAYAALYRWADGAWTTLQAPGLFALPPLAAGWAALAVDAVAGSAWAAFGERLPLPQGAALFAHEHNRAAALLRLARHGAAAGLGADAADALPLYLRDQVALTTLEREALRAAKALAAA